MFMVRNALVHGLKQCGVIKTVTMTTLDKLLVNYTLEEGYNIDECPCSELNKYDAWFNGHDVIFQFTIHAQDVKEAYLIFPGYRVAIIPKRTCIETWVIYLKFPGIAIGAFCFSMYVYLQLPWAVNVRRVVSLSKRFISKDRRLIGNEFLQASRSIRFLVQ